ncbi:hypothetical protein EDF46_1100 [Frondihabitans sp. PhB188]|nr:hypothetical protein EDF46_1100 [Frondihabitans sp. PhB188]
MVGVTVLIVSLLVACIVLLIVVQSVARHRRLQKRADAGQASLPATTWIVFGASAAFLIFAVFVLPAILRA